MNDVFRVLVVCTGNLCRSPVAEALLATALEERLGEQARRVEVTSAGTRARAGAPMHPRAAEALLDVGIDPHGFEGTVLDASLVERADLVLAMAREHRAAVCVIHPRAARYAFTLPQVARLLGAAGAAETVGAAAAPAPPDDVVERARAVLDAVRGARGTAPPARPEDDDVADPLGGTDADFQRSLVRIWRGLHPLVDALAPVGVTAAP